jgi:hypothetical protein
LSSVIEVIMSAYAWVDSAAISAGILLMGIPSIVSAMIGLRRHEPGFDVKEELA